MNSKPYDQAEEEDYNPHTTNTKIADVVSFYIAVILISAIITIVIKMSI